MDDLKAKVSAAVQNVVLTGIRDQLTGIVEPADLEIVITGRLDILIKAWPDGRNRAPRYFGVRVIEHS